MTAGARGLPIRTFIAHMAASRTRSPNETRSGGALRASSVVQAALRDARPARHRVRGDPPVRPWLRSGLDRDPGAGRAEPRRHVELPARARAPDLLRGIAARPLGGERRAG